MHGTLSDTKIHSFLRSAKPGKKKGDGGGLVIYKLKNGGGSWRWNYKKPNGKEDIKTYGQYPEISLKDARDRHFEARRLLAKGIDPKEPARIAKRSASDTLEAIANEFIEKRMEKATPPRAPRTIEKAKGQLREFIFPKLGDRPIHQITLREIRETLQSIPLNGKRIETAFKSKELLGRIYRYAINTREDLQLRNLVADIEAREILGARPDNHLAAILERPKVGELLRAIEGYNGQPATRAALQLLPYVFLRSSELRGAQWSEIDFKRAEWRVPASRMKPVKGKRDEHIVPLSKQATAILKDLHLHTGTGAHVFPAIGAKRRPISENTLGAALAALGYSSDVMTPHGFRAMFRTIAAEDLEIRIDWLELQLGHEVKDSNGRAYNRASFLPQRAKLMQAWSDHLDVLRADTGDNVVAIGSKRSAA